MKKKRIIKLGVVLIILIVGILSFPTIKNYSSNINLLAFFDNTTYEERPLSEVVNKMYVTLLDEKAKVVASTNPETEVDTMYKYTDTEKPQKQVTTQDNLNLLFEIVDTSDENGYTKIEEDVVYTLDLPELIIPEASYDEGVTINNKCYNFSKKGKTTACGGIYQENGKYTFKVKFKNTLNKKDVKASYQTSIKLNPTIEDIIFNIKTIDFNLSGTIQLYIEKEEVTQGTDYIFEVKNNGWTSKTQKYTTWTTIIKNNNISKKTNISLDISFNEYIAFQVDNIKWFKDFDLYADNNKLTSYRNTDGSTGFYLGERQNNDSNLFAKIDIIETVNNISINSNSFLVSKMLLTINNVDNIKIWKINIKTGEAKMSKSDEIIFETNQRLIDNDSNIEYIENKTLKKTYSYEYGKENIEALNLSEVGIPQRLHSDILIYGYNQSAFEIEEKIEEYTGIYRYATDVTDFTCSNYGNDNSGFLNLTIDGELITFEKCNINIENLINGRFEADYYLYNQIKDTIINEYNPLYTSAGNLYKSKEKNIDGDYYYILLNKNTAEKARKSFSNGIYYVERDDANSINTTTRFWIFNASNQKIEMNYNLELNYIRKLSFYDYPSISYYFRINSNGKTVTSNSKNIISIKNNDIERNGNIIIPMRMYGETLDEDIIKWNIEIDYRAMHYDLSNNKNSFLTFFIPGNQHLDTNFYFINNEEILSANEINNISEYNSAFQSNKLLRCISGNAEKHKVFYNNIYYMDNYYTCNKYEEVATLYYGNPMEEMYNMMKSSFLYNDSYYLKNPNSIIAYFNDSNIKPDEDGKVRYAIFTKVHYNDKNNSNPHMLEAFLFSTRNQLYPYLKLKKKGYGKDDIALALTAAGAIKYDNGLSIYEIKGNDNSNVKEWTIFNNLTTGVHFADSQNLSILPIHISKNYGSNHNGTIKYFNKFKSSTNEETIIAKNTKIKSIALKNDSSIKNYSVNSEYIDIDNFIVNNNRKRRYCFTDSYYKPICIEIDYKYDENCSKFDIENNHCKIEDENLYNGVYIKIINAKENQQYEIKYKTETDMEKVGQLLKISNINEDAINITNIIQSNYWDTEKYHSGFPKRESQKNASYIFLADLSIEKNVNQENDENYQNDTKHQEVVATIGYTDSEYLDITDFIDGVSNLKYNTSTKKYDKTDLSTDMNKLKEIRKYVDISNLKISIQKHYNGTYETIYSNGSFTSDYQNSTLTYINNTNELYKLHLVKSSGNIPALTDIKVEYDMTFNLEKENNYRLKDIYKGGKYYISTNVEGIRSYEESTTIDPSGVSYKNKVTIPKKLSSQDGNYENKIDTTNKTLTAYASNTGASIGADYLEPPTIKKEETSYLNKNGQSSWRITYNVNSTGKSEKATLNVNDTMKFNITGNSTYNEPIKQILQDKVKYKNIKIYLNDLQSLIYEYPNTLKSNQTISVNGITGTLSSGNSSYSLVLNNLDYGDIIYITYDLDLDFESAYHEMIENNYIDSNYKLKDTNELLNITYTNGVGSPNYEESFVEKSGSRVSVADFMPTIHKKSNGTANDETSWEMNFNTGTNSSPIKVVDEIEVSSEEEGLKDIIEESLIFKDLEIKVGDTVVYSNEEFIDNWKGNITIKKNPFGYEFNIKDTDNNSFIKDNLKVVIKYKTSLDDSKYKGSKKNGVFSLKNHVDITKNDFTSSDEVLVNGINYDFPMTVDKEFLNISEDLLETNWKITINTGRMNRKNLKISDIATLGSDFGKYLSIKEFRILLNGEEIENDIILNQDNTYNFDITLPEVDKYSTIEIFYTLKVNKEEYILHNEPLDNELLINNKVEVTTDDGTDIEDTDRASSKVLSELTKRFDFLGYDDEGYPIIRWYIDVNLESEYDVSTLEGKEVIITDNLSDILELVDNSITVKTRSVTSNGVSTGSNISTDKYILNTEDNKVQVSLLDPVNTSNLRISFETKCFASISEVENYVTLSVDGEEKELKASRNIRIFSPVVSGYISSREVTNYNIKGYKYLDDKLSTKSFIFEVVEVNEDGTIKENGFSTRNTNSEEGEITFNSLVYDREGFYYYKIKEVVEDNEDIIYDDTEYLLRIKVTESHGEYIIEDVKLLNTDKEEIAFYNKIKPKEEEKPNIIDVIVNPYTGRSILLLLCILIPIIGVIKIRRKRA